MCSNADPSLFVAHTDSHISVLLLYVDDILLTGNSDAMLLIFITFLSEQFSKKDLGDLYYFLGIQVVCSPLGLLLTQQNYVADLLHKFQLQTCKLVRTPFVAWTTLSLSDGELLADPSLYKSMVGAL